MFLKKLKLKSNTEVMVCDNLSGFIDKKRPEFMYHSDVNAINNLKKEENFMINYKLLKGRNRNKAIVFVHGSGCDYRFLLPIAEQKSIQNGYIKQLKIVQC